MRAVARVALPTGLPDTVSACAGRVVLSDQWKQSKALRRHADDTRQEEAA